MATETSELPLGPESRDKEARMRAMTNAAVGLFAEEGLGGVSTRRVAERAGCSETLLFRYFGGKRGLLLAICNQLTDLRRESIRAQDFSDPQKYLERHMLETFDHMRHHGAAIRIVAAAVVNDRELSTEFERRHEEAVAYLAEQLRHFQESGDIAPDVDLRAVSAGIEQMLFAIGLLLQLVYGKPRSHLAVIARSMAQVLAGGLQTDATGKPPKPWRREAIGAARRASQDLKHVIALLESVEEDGGAEAPGGLASRKRRPRRRSSAS